MTAARHALGFVGENARVHVILDHSAVTVCRVASIPRCVAMTKRLPRGDEAILDIRKIEDYCLNPSHPRGCHKARIFREVLGLQRNDAA